MLRKVIKEIQCCACGAVPGFHEASQNRYLCNTKSHVYCIKCQDVLLEDAEEFSRECKYQTDNCDGEIMKIPSPIVKTLLKDMPCFCPNFRHGCREIFAEAFEMTFHMGSCIYRMVHCIAEDCPISDEYTRFGWEDKIVFKDLMDHVKASDHQTNSVNFVSGTKFQIKIDLDLGIETWNPWSFEGNVACIIFRF